jgi:hypothetical protein
MAARAPEYCLGLSFGVRNRERALATARGFAPACGARACLVMETELDRGEVSGELARLAGDWKVGWLWDARCTATVLEGWPKGLPLPFYRGISYGGNVNHLLILAAFAGAGTLVRVDPGTFPLDDPARFLDRHYDALARRRLVSGVYDGRLALRDDFVPEARRKDYYELIARRTGTDPLRQLTGGAALARKVDSVPDIAFDGVMAYSSDDGFHQRFGCADVDPEWKVGRRDPGYPQSCGEYVHRLANAVVLDLRHGGETDPDAAALGARQFLEELKEIAGPGFDIRPAPARAIFAGYENYIELRRHWAEVLNAASGRIAPLRL